MPSCGVYYPVWFLLDAQRMSSLRWCCKYNYFIHRIDLFHEIGCCRIIEAMSPKYHLAKIDDLYQGLL